jgi:hypothetical protein
VQPSCPRIFSINTPLPDITQDVHIAGSGAANTAFGKFDADL